MNNKNGQGVKCTDQTDNAKGEMINLFNELIINEQIIADGIGGDEETHFEIRLQYINGLFRFTCFNLNEGDTVIDFDDKEEGITFIKNNYNLNFFVRFDEDEEVKAFLP